MTTIHASFKQNRSMWSLPGIALLLTGSIQAPKSHEPVGLAELDRLVKLYRQLDLPIPPPNAPLVSTDTMEERSRIRCGYLIDKSEVMSGTIVTSKFFNAKPIEPTAKNARILQLHTGPSLPFHEDFGVGLAVIERTRKHDALALELLSRINRNEDRWHGPSAFPQAPENASAEVLVRYLALQHWLNSVVESKSDRGTVLRHLAALVTRYPSLNEPSVEAVIRGLTANAAPRYKGSDPIERLIDSLCDCQANGQRLESPDPSQKSLFAPLINLVSYGYEAVPKLIKHAGDMRYTRAVEPGEMMSPPQLVTVGAVCLNLAEQFSMNRSFASFAIRKQAVTEWWKEESKKNERESCLNRLLQTDDFLPDAPIRWAERRFPDILLLSYNNIISKNRRTETTPLLEAMERSTLDRKLIIEAAEKGALSKNLNNAHAAIWALERLDRAKFDSALVALLIRLPKAANGPAWLSQEASFAQQVGCSDSAEVWSALTDATRRANVDLRLELLQESEYADHPKNGRKEFLKYLQAFFSDTTEAFPKKPTKDDPTPESAHVDLSTTRVQDLAATLAAHELRIKEIPDRAAPRSKWDEFRERLTVKIATELKSQ